MAARILADVQSTRLLRLEVSELKLQLTTRLERIELLKEALKQSKISEDNERNAKELAFIERDEAKLEVEVWYRHPVFLVSLGAVGVIIIEVAVVGLFRTL